MTTKPANTEMAATVAAPRVSRISDAPHHCRRDQTVVIREYPLGGFVTLAVCSDCRAMYADADLSEALK